MRLLGLIGLYALVNASLLACIDSNPDYCDNDNRPCLDAARPFCDIKGEHPASGGLNNTCIPDPFAPDAGTGDASPDSDGQRDQLPPDTSRGDSAADTLVPASLVGDPTSHDFGSVPQDSLSTIATITLENTGQIPSGTIGTSVSGTSASEFEILDDRCSGASLSAGGTCQVQLRMLPTSLGAKEATLTLTSDPGGSVAMALSGTGVAPAALRFAKTTHDYKILDQGTTSSSQSFAVQNTGSSATGPIAVSLDDDTHFSVLLSCDGALAPSASCDVHVAFTPKSVGAHNATLVASAVPGGQATVALAGTGQASLRVEKPYSGQGGVVSIPAGIDCGSQCSADFTASSVSLTAEATGDSCFGGWAGGCSGTSATCTVTLDQAKTATAYFREPSLLLTLTTTSTGSTDSFSAYVENEGCTLFWEYGDGSARVAANRVSHTYTTAGEKTVSIYSAEGGRGITSIRIANENLTGPIPEPAAYLPNLKILRLNHNQLTGPIPEIVYMLPLEELALNSNMLAGTLEEFPISATTIALGDNQFSGVGNDLMQSLSVAAFMVDLANNNLTQAAVDSLIDQLYEIRDTFDNTPKFLHLSGGTNAVPSPASLAKINELESDAYKWRISCNGSSASCR